MSDTALSRPMMDRGAFARARFIYDTYRTSLMNAKYYGHRVVVLKRINLTFEIAIALGATGSGVAGILQDSPLFGLNTGNKYGIAVWHVLAALSVFLATLKPLLDFGSKIEAAARLYGGYQEHYISMQRLCAEIAAEEGISESVASRFDSIHDKYIALFSADEPKPSRRLLVRFQDEVNVEIPVDALWWPPSRSSAS